MMKAGLEAALAEIWRKGGIRARFLIWPDKHLKIQTTIHNSRMIDAHFSEN
jgi:hypothetical protein